MLEQLQSWYSNNVAFANTSGILSAFIICVLSVITAKAKKKEQTIKIDVSNANDNVNNLANTVNTLLANQITLNDSMQIIANMIKEFSGATTIRQEIKNSIDKQWASIQNKIIQIQPNVENVVQEAKNTVINDIVPVTQEIVQETVETGKSIFDELRKQAG